MLGTKLDSFVCDHSFKTFTGVRFVLLGFDPINAQKVRSKLVNGGGIDVCRFGPDCTHVVVDNITYDDPMCVVARSDGKILVTGLWVDHSFDVGMPVDPTSVMYRPLRDLNGIPGARSLTVCLTGYQRQDREDIMTMVGLMGANFSKPLAANKVTHLVCYKFEGEKYELAKKMKKIKLVNHQWLEDCLRAWEILPEGNYDKSGYELQMELEAKDSDEEAAAQEITEEQDGGRKNDASPQNLHIQTLKAHGSLQSKEDISSNLQILSASKGLSSAGNNTHTVLPLTEETISNQDLSSQFHNKHEGLSLQDFHEKHANKLGSRGNRTLGDVAHDEPFDKAGKDLPSTSGSAGSSPHSDAAKSSGMSYLKKTPSRDTFSTFSRHAANVLSSSPEADLDKFNVNGSFDISSSRTAADNNEANSNHFKTPRKEIELHYEGGKSGALPEKRKADVSHSIAKSQKMSHSPVTGISRSKLEVNGTGESEHAVPINGALDEDATPNHGCNSSSSIALSFSTLDRQSFLMPVQCTDTSANSPENNSEVCKTSTIGLQNMSLSSKPCIKDVVEKTENAVSEVGKPVKELQNAPVPSPKTSSIGTKKVNSPTLGLFNGGNSNSISKPSGRKVVSRKSLGTRTKLGPSNVKNQKGPIYLNEAAAQANVVATISNGEEELVEMNALVNSEKVEIIPLNFNVDKTMVERNHDLGSRIEVDNVSRLIDGETEATVDKEEQGHEPEGGAGEKPEGVYMIDKTNTVSKNKSEDMQPTALGTHADSVSKSGYDHIEALGEDDNEENEHNELTTDDYSGKENLDKQKSHPTGKSLRMSTPFVTKRIKLKEGANVKDIKSKKHDQKIGNKKQKGIGVLTCKAKRTTPLTKSENSTELEKENTPVGVGDQNNSHDKRLVGNVASKPNRTPVEINVNVSTSSQGSVLAEKVPKLKVEPTCFILTGHRFQRKEFQQIIRRLKGKVCRDSHQWSYHATHLIVPDPIRRTEKFFAAAASGRWILKTDYLTSCNEAGRLLAEEPYEWHRKGLSEDGAINLEAPRKWRLLRERTGHGAFHRMRVVIYGECIAPSLDTLKRVIKAGDGTILATSPPYSRVLNSEIDFAIVSPGMPRVDIWVQEFLRHEIPCVTADYLVEYVCKPGYPLERHVQYNTHAWAEKSFSNLQRWSGEILEEQTHGEDDKDDLPCQVCGSRERGEVMLICGDESGSMGCGIGTHIDCLNPPLERVPDEDWFCLNCSESMKVVNLPRTTGKGTSLSRGK